MSTIDDHQRLVQQLIRGASGMFLHEAAIRLLDRHNYWLHDRKFRQFIRIDDSLDDAGIDFSAAMDALAEGALGAPEEEAERILRIAASLSGVHAIFLREVVEGIDRENIKHVAEAIMYADGFLNSVADPRP